MIQMDQTFITLLVYSKALRKLRMLGAIFSFTYFARLQPDDCPDGKGR